MLETVTAKFLVCLIALGPCTDQNATKVFTAPMRQKVCNVYRIGPDQVRSRYIGDNFQYMVADNEHATLTCL